MAEKLWAIKLASGELLLNDARDFHRGPWIWERKEAAEEALSAARAATHQYAESVFGWRMARVVPVTLTEEPAQ